MCWWKRNQRTKVDGCLEENFVEWQIQVGNRHLDPMDVLLLLFPMFQNVATAGPTATTPSGVTNTTQNWRHGPLPELTVKLRPRSLETWPPSRTRTPTISWQLSQMKPSGSVDSRFCLTSMYINIQNSFEKWFMSLPLHNNKHDSLQIFGLLIPPKKSPILHII